MGFCFGVDEIGQAFGFGEVKFAIVEGAAGKFSRFGKAAAWNGREGLKYGPGDGMAAMDMKLSAIFGGEAFRAWHPEDEATVEFFSARWMVESAQGGGARRRPSVGG